MRSNIEREWPGELERAAAKIAEAVEADPSAEARSSAIGVAAVTNIEALVARAKEINDGFAKRLSVSVEALRVELRRSAALGGHRELLLALEGRGQQCASLLRATAERAAGDEPAPPEQGRLPLAESTK